MKTLEELAKEFSTLAGHFKKAAAHHEALHKAHAGMASQHTDLHTMHKAKADGLDDGHEMKAHLGKMAECHKALADHHTGASALHKAHAEYLDGLSAEGDGKAGKVDDLKKDVVVTQVADIQGSLGAFLSDAVKANMEELKSDPSFKELIKGAVLEGVKLQLANKVEPTNVRGALDDNPNVRKDNVKLILRPGQVQLEKVEVDPQLENLFEMPVS
jgi:hypothetical protein